MTAAYLTADQAAERAHLTRSGLRTLTARAAGAGVELRAPRASWPGERAPLYDADALDAYLAARPGRGRKVAAS